MLGESVCILYVFTLYPGNSRDRSAFSITTYIYKDLCGILSVDLTKWL